MIRKHSITLSGHRTSFSLEDEFMDCLKDMAKRRGIALAALIGEIDEQRPADANLSSALRIAVLGDLRIAVKKLISN